MDNRDWDREEYENWRRHGHDRGFFEAMKEEIKSWFGHHGEPTQTSQWIRNVESERTYGTRSGANIYDGANPVERWSNVSRDYAQSPSHRGRGPRNYVRNDERIREDVVERLTAHHAVDAVDIEVTVQNGEVTLGGMVENRFQKRLTMDIAEDVFGVKNVNNQLRVREYGFNRGGDQKREADGNDRAGRSAANLRG